LAMLAAIRRAWRGFAASHDGADNRYLQFRIANVYQYWENSMSDGLSLARFFVMLLCTSMLAAIFQLQPAFAASHEQIMEMCIQALMPQLRACGQTKGIRKSSDPVAFHEQCGLPIVRPCVIREEAKQAVGTPAPAVPKYDSAVAPASDASIQPAFVAPPRTIADVTAILDSEKPDDVKIAARKEAAEAAPPSNVSPAKLAEFYHQRGIARALLAHNKDALVDGLQALEIANRGVEPRQMSEIRSFVALQYKALGDPKNSIAVSEFVVRQADEPGHRGSLIAALSNIVRTLISMGDISQASTYTGRIQQRVEEARGSPNPKWRAAYPIYGHAWESDTDSLRGALFEARGQYSDAEAAFRRAEAFRRAAIKDLPRFNFPPPPEQFLLGADRELLAVARNESKQGRLIEAEADARRALLEILKSQGKYSPAAPQFIVGLASILVEQGRYPDAEKLARTALDVQRTLGIGDDSPETVHILAQLGNILIAERNANDAAVVYAQLQEAIAQWTPQQREVFEFNSSRIAALYATGQVDAGIRAAEELVKRQTTHTGANSFDTAQAHGTLAVGYARAGRDTDAIREFRTALPILMAANRDTDDDDPTLVGARVARLQRIVEAYIAVLARNPNISADVAVETFGLADAVRGQAVQQALTDSSARMAAKDPVLAQLVRTDQDHSKQINAELGALNNMLALPSDQRDDQSIRATNAEVEKLRAERKAARQEITKRFPAYANLIDPKPPTVDAIKATLRPGEALLSFYFGQDKSFVWAVSKDGNVAFAAVPVTALQLDAKVRMLRQALEPQVTMVSEIPPFDLTMAYELYALLLKPIEAGWQRSKSLIVVTNGALGELPLGLLPTAPSQGDPQGQLLFSGYRNVPWLARTHAVTAVPSAAALITLRNLPPGSPSRDKLIGFGDPYFNAQEAAEAEAEQHASEQIASADTSEAGSVTTRGIRLMLRAAPHTEDIDEAELALLPRLPDTRLELMSIANALGVDPSKALYLGRDANEQNVNTLDLSHYRIVAFATHGLVPGDLDGLTQPALALTAPDIVGIKGDGILTMGKILALKLDADWVVLSACNTAAGAGAGTEAASGLGSAFFYAGTRALLVTNWSVHSASARELITDVFRRQSADPSLSRGEALRQAMMALLDGPGAVDASGQTLYTYAHPFFWAPYSVIGDGGGN
jgi:CHAT domain-containing protein